MEPRSRQARKGLLFRLRTKCIQEREIAGRDALLPRPRRTQRLRSEDRRGVFGSQWAGGPNVLRREGQVPGDSGRAMTGFKSHGKFRINGGCLRLLPRGTGERCRRCARHFASDYPTPTAGRNHAGGTGQSRRPASARRQRRAGYPTARGIAATRPAWRPCA